MGRPISKKWFGEYSSVELKIVVAGVKFSDGATFTNAYIIQQKGTSRYLVQDALKTHAPEIVKLANANSVGELDTSECFIFVRLTADQTIVPIRKLTSNLVSVYQDTTVNTYKWSFDQDTGAVFLPNQTTELEGILEFDDLPVTLNSMTIQFI